MSSKEQEILYLESLRRARPDLPLDAVQPSERPDFLAEFGSRRRGIEVTRFTPLIQPGTPKPEEQDSLQQWALRCARNSYRASGGKPLHVSANFNPYHPLTKRDTSDLSSRIARFLLACSKRMVLYHTSSFDRSVGRAFLPELDSLRAIHVATEDQGVWTAGQAGWVRHAEEGDVSRIVAGKEQRVDAYRKLCDELWLLMIFDVLGGNTYVRPPVEPVEFTIRTSFHRLFCLAPVGDRCVEVPAAPAA